MTSSHACPGRFVLMARAMLAGIAAAGVIVLSASASDTSAKRVSVDGPSTQSMGVIDPAGRSSPARERAGARPDQPIIGFVPNRGQFPPQVRFRAVVGQTTVVVLDDEIVEVRHDATALVQRRRFGGGVRFEPVVASRLPGVLHFLHSNDRERWATNVPHYGAIAAYGPDGRDTVDVQLEAGRLTVTTSGRSGIPFWDRWSDTDRAGRTILQEPVPQLAYSTYLGGGSHEVARGLAVDGAGHAYVAGSTTSTDWPVADPLQPEIGNSGVQQDAFVAKLAPDGTALVYATYLGGVRQDEALDIAVDASGRVHLTGYTMSPDFPMEKPIQPRVNLADGIFSGDAFVTRLSPDGSALEFSTPLGGTARDIGKGIAVDDLGHTYVTGWTGSNFPAKNALYPANRGVTDAFVAKLTPAGDALVYSTHLGGSTYDLARDIAVDAAGSAHIVGWTESVNFRVSDPLQRANAGGRDAFVAKFAPDGQAVTWATYLGGRTDDYGIGIALGVDGTVTVVGRTDSPNFPREGAIQLTRSGPADLFITRLTAAGDALLYSTYLGGSAVEADCAEVDSPRVPTTPTPASGVPRLPDGSRFPDGPVAAIAVDASGRTYVSTCTASTNVALVRPIQDTRRGSFAAYLAVLDPAGAALEFASYIAGQGLDIPRAIAAGADGSIYVAGQTTSSDFPLAPAVPLQGHRSGTDDAFVLKIADVFEPPTASPPPPTATQEPTPTSPATNVPTITVTSVPTLTSTPEPTTTPTEAPTGVWLPYACKGCQ